MTNLTVSDLFDRHGDPAPADAAIKLDGKQPYYVRRDKCCRCGGSGIYTQFHGTCYRCAGKGIVDHLDIHKVKLYTREQNAKLDAAAAKRASAKTVKVAAQAAVNAQAFDAAHAALVAAIPAAWLVWGEGAIVTGDVVTIRDIVTRGRQLGSITPKQQELLARLVPVAHANIEAARVAAEAKAVQAATSQFVGTISQKLAVAVTCTKVATFERDSFGYRGGRETVNVCTFVDANGNILVTKTPAFRAEVGEAGILTGQVKQHNVYQDVKQTQLIRPRWQEAV